MPSGRSTLRKNCVYMFTGSLPKWTIFPTPPPTGTTQLWLGLTSQFAVMIGDELVRYHPCLIKVVLPEGLHQHLIYVRARRWSRNREQVLHKRSKQPMTLNSNYNDSRSDA